MDLTPIPSQTVGPFFHLNIGADRYCIRCIAGPEAKGERVQLSCRVFDGEGSPVPDALIEIWQADAEGRYHSPEDANGNAADPACRGFGRLPTGDDGSCEFETIKPGRVVGPANALQAPHMLVALFARGLLAQLCTRIYFAGDPSNREDPVLALVPQDRRETLMAKADPASAGRWCFDIHLQGDHETVFFDV